jgi:hypothetical protein
VSAFPQINRVKQCRHGMMLYNVHDLYVGRSLDQYGEFSQGEIDLFGQILKPGQVVLDVGANIGAHTLWFAQTVGPSGTVLAFEPQRIVFQALCANLAHTPPLYNPNNFLGNAVNVFGSVVSLNMLCLPRDMPQKVSGLLPVQVPPPAT